MTRADSLDVQINNEGLSNGDFNRCEPAIRDALNWVPERHLSGLRTIIVHNHADWRRGLAGEDIIYLKCLENLAELQSVLIHEIGHIVDLNLIRKTARLNYFNEISWIKDIPINNGFVSGYAASNNYEDFAETYAYYVLHGNNFRFVSLENVLLNRKYNFMNYAVFAGMEFELQNKQRVLTSQNQPANMGNTYDVTRLSYEQKQ